MNQPAVPQIRPGITEFFSSQADVLLTQYMNIERMLGATYDYTAPGTHCEVLLRDFLRSHLPSWVSVDKGFIFGRTNRWTIETINSNPTDVEREFHCPEIDILIHDTHLYRPVFRLDDFVIVQPEAVLGIIQVKRSFNSDQFSDGVRNIVNAKRHLLEMFFQKEGSRCRMPGPRYFSAVVEFADVNHQNATFKEKLQSGYDSQIKYESGDKEAAKMWVLPSFIGSISSKFAMRVDHSVGQSAQDYDVYSATQGDHNVGLQALLWLLTMTLWGFSSDLLRQVEHSRPLFQFPNGMQRLHHFTIPT